MMWENNISMGKRRYPQAIIIGGPFNNQGFLQLTSTTTEVTVRNVAVVDSAGAFVNGFGGGVVRSPLFGSSNVIIIIIIISSSSSTSSGIRISISISISSSGSIIIIIMFIIIVFIIIIIIIIIIVLITIIIIIIVFTIIIVMSSSSPSVHSVMPPLSPITIPLWPVCLAGEPPGVIRHELQRLGLHGLPGCRLHHHRDQ
jgi:hypothetical protein